MQRYLGRPALAVLISFSFALFAPQANAARITQVKGDQVLVDLEGDSSFVEGARYLVMVEGKRKAVVELSKVRGGKAIGKTLKGTSVQSATLAPLSGGGSAQASSESSPSPSRSKSRRSRRGGLYSSMTFGVLAGYATASQDVTKTNETIMMKGSSLSVKAFADLPVSGELGVLARFGIENFGVTGDSVSAGGPVETKIMYVDADALLRYYFLSGNLRLFPLAGMGLHYPLSKTSGVLDVARISATTIFFLGGGVNYAFSDSMYGHLTVEYGLFPPSNDVKTSLIGARFGVGFAF